MRNFTLWIRWLVVVGWILVAFGIALAALNQTRLFDVAFHQRIDPAFWSQASVPSDARRFQEWIYGVLGATVAGWGVFVVFLARNPIKNRERWAWTCLFVGFTLWFLVDTTISAYFGVFFNVAFNVALALLMYVPLVALQREMNGREGNRSSRHPVQR